MLERVCYVAGTVTDRVVLLGRPPQVPDSLRGITVLEDTEPGLGPMGGLRTILAAYPETAVLLLACDLPLTETRLLELLLEAPTGPDTEAVCFENPERSGSLEPCCGLYFPAIQVRVERAIGRRARSIQALLQEARVVRARVPAGLTDCLRNINTPDDYRSIEGRNEPA